MGNLFSIKKVFEKMGVEVTISNSPEDVNRAQRIILPGVGHFRSAMNNLKAEGLIEVLNRKVICEKVPILGICLGMQLMARRSEEGDAEGLCWIDADVVRFDLGAAPKYKVPHVGFNTLTQEKRSRILMGVDEKDEFYFLHSFHLQADNALPISATTVYGYSFVSTFESENLFAVQFHPELSRIAGEKVIKNFLSV